MDRNTIAWAEFASDTNVGHGRDHNEDRFLLEPWPGEEALLAVVADGLGGHRGGEVAAQIVVDTFAKLLTQPFPSERPDCYDMLLRQFYVADTAIREQGAEQILQYGMGATVVAAIVTPQEYIYLYAGDCRFYHFQTGQATPVRVSADHTIIRLLLDSHIITPDQVATHPMRSVINSCLGGRGNSSQLTVAPPWQADLPPIYLWQSQDWLLLSSDGLHGSIPEAQFQELIQQHDSADALVKALMEAALQGDNQDNMTVIALRNKAAL